METMLENLLANTGDMALRRRAQWLVLSLELKEGERVLDMGCGDGYYLFLFSKLNLDLRLFGVDCDRKALSSARGHLKNRKITLICADITKGLPFENGYFDKVIMSEVCEHLKDDVSALREVYRVLKPGGKCVCSVPHSDYPIMWDPINWILERLSGKHIGTGFFAGIWNQHLRLYSHNDLRKSIKKAGFRQIRVQALTHFVLPFNHYAINAVARFLASPGVSKSVKKRLSKFESPLLLPAITPFTLIRLFDKLNDFGSCRGSCVSLVASCIK